MISSYAYYIFLLICCICSLNSLQILIFTIPYNFKKRVFYINHKSQNQMKYCIANPLEDLVGTGQERLYSSFL